MIDSVNEARKGVSASRSRLDSCQRELMASISQSSELTSKKAALESKAEAARDQVERLISQVEEQNEYIVNPPRHDACSCSLHCSRLLAARRFGTAAWAM